MFKKFNWGHGITIFYICFVAAVVTVLIASFSIDHSLVVDDYYAKDLAYQSQYDKAQNSLSTKSIKINNDEAKGELTIDFANENNVEGSVYFYRPSDKSQDFKVKIEDKETKISTKSLLPGKWIIKVDWTEDGKPFYAEELVYI